MNDFLPINKIEMHQRGWDNVDFVFITGDSYVDHPSFGVAVLSRLLEYKGYKVAILSQPNWKDTSYFDFTQFGKPKLGFLIASGNIDSMVAHYTAAKKKRSDDAYTAGNKAGKRPDRAVTVYSKIVKKLYPDSIVIIGGLEASLRRFAHYDYWSDTVRPSILLESKADILAYGMGESQMLAIAEYLETKNNFDKNSDGLKKWFPDLELLKNIRGICYAIKTADYSPCSAVDLPSYKRVIEDKKDYMLAAKKQYEEADSTRGKGLIQRHDFEENNEYGIKSGNYILVQNPPALPLSTEQLDEVYELPYKRTYHPFYEKDGGVPAILEVGFSITHNRGCFGACNFCSLAFHQGRAITVRSEESIIKEAKKLTDNPNFKGYIHDVGGPTANFRKPSCELQKENGLCKNKKCLAPTPCNQLQVDHSEYLHILNELSNLPKVKKVFVRSGIRFDYLILDDNKDFFIQLVKNHVSGQLKVAPEHCSSTVLDKMGKPHLEAYKKFCDEFYKITKSVNKEQYLVPYLMSSHPGSSINDAIELALFLKKEKIRPEQVQDFYPTPGTISTAMFYTELDPYTLEKIYVPKTPRDKALQRALLQYFDPKNRENVIYAMKSAGKESLIKELLPGYKPNLSKGKVTAYEQKKKIKKIKKRKN